MNYRKLKIEEMSLLKEIDRSEIVNYKYIYNRDEGALSLKDEYYNIEGWDREELEEYIGRMEDIYNRGGTVLGCFDNEKIVGIGSLDNIFFGKSNDRVKLDILYISNDYRGKGIGRNIVHRLEEIGRDMGARSIYISATPFKGTVDFYRTIGAILTKDIDRDLYELEPEDIHMELFL